jgi:hypothetical protein
MERRIMNEIELSLEIPFDYVNSFCSKEDLSFCIAPYALQNSRYACAYGLLSQQGKPIIVDNGMYELNHPIDNEGLISVAHDLRSFTNVPYIIAPDILWNPMKSYERTTAFREQACSRGLKNIGAVVHGTNVQRMIDHYKVLVQDKYEPICITFLENRIDFLKEIRLENDIWHHFLGMTTLDEIHYIRKYIPLPKRVSFDTCKPIKAAVHMKSIRENVRGLGRWDPEIKLTQVQSDLAHSNIDILKQTLQSNWYIAMAPKRYVTQEELCGTESSFPKKGG